jgi:hypothetical protein
MSIIRRTILSFLTTLVDGNKELIYREAEFLGSFMHRLMKSRNTGNKWTREEKKHVIRDIRHLSYCVPALMIFLLPGGPFFLPLLAEALDRRDKTRTVQERAPVPQH